MASEQQAVIKPALNPRSGFTWWLAVTVAGFAGLVLTLGAPHIIGRPIKAGDVAHTNLAAARSAGLVDEVETGRARERARQSVLPVFKRDHSLDRVMLDELQLRLDQVSRLQVECGLP